MDISHTHVHEHAPIFRIRFSLMVIPADSKYELSSAGSPDLAIQFKELRKSLKKRKYHWEREISTMIF